MTILMDEILQDIVDQAYGAACLGRNGDLPDPDLAGGANGRGLCGTRLNARIWMNPWLPTLSAKAVSTNVWLGLLGGSGDQRKNRSCK